MKSRVRLVSSIKKSKRQKAIIISIISVVVLVIGFLASFETLENLFAGKVVDQAMTDVKRNKAKQKHKASFNFEKVEEISPSSLAKAYAHRNDYRPVGQIVIRKLSMRLNIYQGVGNVELNLGAGTMKPGQEMGKQNYALAGHNMHDHRYFSNLYWGRQNGTLGGTTVYLTDYKKVYYYTIESSSFIRRNRVDLIKNNPEFEKKPVLSMFTCDWTGAGRLFVIARLTGFQEIDCVSKDIRKSFSF